jgi:hypothetical protein
MIKPNKAKALMLAKRQLVEFVWDAVTLEGINFTLPEIQTLLDGITVGGHRLSGFILLQLELDSDLDHLVGDGMPKLELASIAFLERN